MKAGEAACAPEPGAGKATPAAVGCFCTGVQLCRRLYMGAQ